VKSAVRPSAPTSDSADAGILPARQAAWLVAFMWGAYFLNYCDRQVVFALFPVLKSDLGFSNDALGLTGSIFLWVYGLGCPIAGYLGDRYSKRRLVVLSLTVWSLVTVATGLSTSIGMMLSLRAAMGVSEALFMPAAVALVANGYAPERRSRAVAVVSTAQIVGTVAGSWFGGWMGDQGLWRWAFFALGAVGLIYMLPYHLFLRGLPATQARAAAGTSSPFAAAGMLRIPTFALLCVVFPSFVFGLWLIYGWLPSFLGEKFSLNLADAAFNATVYLQGATLVGVLCGGYLADALFRRTRAARLWLLTGGVLLSAPAMYAIGSCETLAATRIAAATFGLFSGLFMGNIFPAAFEVVRFDARASAVGLLNLFGACISGFAVWFGGTWKASLGIDTMLAGTSLGYVAAGLVLLGAILFTFPRDYARMQVP
jgi:predicted MFS family arabinose efflux permease